MRLILFVLTSLAVVGLAFWAYRENYATQQALSDMAALQDEIADLRDGLTLQRAEWAYLNRPERLNAIGGFWPALGAILPDLCSTAHVIRRSTSAGLSRAEQVDAAFGNSIHDAAMLNLARHAFAVNPNPDLEKLARLRELGVAYPNDFQPAHRFSQRQNA